VYQYDKWVDGLAFSLPSTSIFSVAHPTATRPVIYVQLSLGVYPPQLVRHPHG
jgi:hypothetical protein